MIAYSIKVILCSAFFFVIYKALLEKEVLHGYNRFYLLSGLLLSLLIPLFTITSAIPVVDIMGEEVLFSLLPGSGSIPAVNTQPAAAATGWNISVWHIVLLLYGVITFVLLCRFLVNLSRLFISIRVSEGLPYQQDAVLLLQKERSIPYCFLKYIFVNKEDYVQEKINEEVLYHELIHVRQRHSYDNLLLELIQVFFWFNPLLVLYKRSIRLNHEYLADSSVVSRFRDKERYQYMLINMSCNLEKPGVFSQFNYLITKKRLIMMTKTTPSRRGLYKQLAVIPLFLVAVFLFSTRSSALVLPDPGQNTPVAASEYMGQEESAPVKEFNAIHAKGYQTVNGNRRYNMALISEEDVNKMRTLFLSMSEADRSKLNGTFERRKPFKEETPTEQDMEDWKDPTQYGIWVDGKRINNADLANYNRTDIAASMKSRLMKNAKDYGKYVYHLNLITKETNRKIAEDETLYFSPINFGKNK